MRGLDHHASTGTQPWQGGERSGRRRAVAGDQEVAEATGADEATGAVRRGQVAGVLDRGARAVVGRAGVRHDAHATEVQRGDREHCRVGRPCRHELPGLLHRRDNNGNGRRRRVLESRPMSRAIPERRRTTTVRRRTRRAPPVPRRTAALMPLDSTSGAGVTRAILLGPIQYVRAPDGGSVGARGHRVSDVVMGPHRVADNDAVRVPSRTASRQRNTRMTATQDAAKRPGQEPAPTRAPLRPLTRASSTSSTRSPR